MVKAAPTLTLQTVAPWVSSMAKSVPLVEPSYTLPPAMTGSVTKPPSAVVAHRTWLSRRSIAWRP